MKVPGGHGVGKDAGPTVGTEKCPRWQFVFLSDVLHNQGKDRDYNGVLQSADLREPRCASSICGMRQYV